eukprot:TRINITY_DN8854_c0_g1_i2.p1 TRINITY_DN8854_c0_g1~~TRINITY_DN8854_c0_g1_i2.p1  ORF type:complete len:579 (+),score=14.07 TRINITY_DN8854_c0_g1_i2:622-2358(+)
MNQNLQKQCVFSSKIKKQLWLEGRLRVVQQIIKCSFTTSIIVAWCEILMRDAKCDHQLFTNTKKVQMRPVVCVSPPLVSLLVLSFITNILLIYSIFKGQFSESSNISQFLINTSPNPEYQVPAQTHYLQTDRQEVERRIFLYSDELGVQHYTFFGKIFEYNKTPKGLRHDGNLTAHSNITRDLENIFIVHLFLKSRIANKKLKIRGFVVGEEYPESYHYRAGIMEVPEILQNAWRDIWMLDVNNRTNQYQIQYNAKYNYTLKCKTCPLCVMAEYPKQLKDSVFELHMSTFRRHHYFSHSIAQAKSKYLTSKNQRQQLIFVLAGPFYDKFYKGVEPSYLARVLAYHIHYHITYMAIDRYLIYCRENYLNVFLQDKDIEQYAQKGIATVVLWQEVANYFNKKYALQPTMISHAILAHWGANVRLLIGDVDEFAGTPIPQANLPTLINTCKIKPLSYIYRKEYLCQECVKNPPPYQTQLWQGDIAQIQPLIKYNLMKIIDEQNNPKGFIDPKRVCSWSVHVGVPVQADIKFNDIQTTCLYLVHLRHMFRDRRRVKSNLSDFTQSSDWLWMFDNSLTNNSTL